MSTHPYVHPSMSLKAVQVVAPVHYRKKEKEPAARKPNPMEEGCLGWATSSNGDDFRPVFQTMLHV